ncbi:MAG: TonB-dependent receptor [Myxococcales bacterium]
MALGRLLTMAALSLPILGAGTLCVSPVEAQQGAAGLIGTIRDASTGKPVADAVVTVTSPALQGEELAVTDAQGGYRILGLPPGVYTLRVEAENFKPYAREALDLHVDATLRLNGSLLPEALKAQEVVVVGRTPTVDVGSSSVGMNITSDFTTRIPVSMPGGKGSSVRSFESVADVVPGVQADPFGMSMFGASSGENRYLIDGQSVSNSLYGLNNTPLSIDFMKEVSVLSGGYMPEYGRSTGGIFNAITKSGSNEVHASVWANYAPGALSGDPKVVQRDGQTVVTTPKLDRMFDIGGDVSGPIIKDKLWFYAGFDYAQSKYNLKRSLHESQFADDGTPLLNDDGSAQTKLIPGTTKTYAAQQDMFQAIGKLTWAANSHNRVNLSVNGVYPVSGGDGKYGFHPDTGLPQISTQTINPYYKTLNGSYDALANVYKANSTNALLKWTSELDGKRLFLDSWLGYNNANNSTLPSDGSKLGSNSGLAGQSNVWVLRDPQRSITDFEKVPMGACQSPAGNPDAISCPVTDYRTGGPELLEQYKSNRVQARSVLTYLFEGFGHHTAKLGFDLEHQWLDNRSAYTGGRDFVDQSYDGQIYEQQLANGYLSGPDQPVVLQSIHKATRSMSMGGFVQDSWAMKDWVTLNAGLRYDAQLMYARDGSLAMVLPNQVSPRAGLIFDPTSEGKSKLFVNYARYYETVPLRMLDRYLSGEPFLYSYADGAACDPTKPGQAAGACTQYDNLLPWGAAPNSKYAPYASGTSTVDPKIKAPSTDEFVSGGEYEIIEDGRLGLTYSKRWLNQTIEDMSRDEANTYFFGNPGSGIAKDFPKAERKYDGVTLYFTKLYSHGWMAQASYTVSWLRGNYTGLYSADSLQNDPHMNSDFDLRSLTVNRNGYLPGDHRHYFRAFGAREFELPGKFGAITPGAGFRAYSGGPTSVLGSHPLYLTDQVYILDRGEGERLPWVYNVDVRLAYGFKFEKDRTISLTMDIFNLFNFQQVTARDQRYTTANVRPVESGGLANLQNDDGTPFDPANKNPNFGRATAYQAPRMFRFGIKGTF